MLLLLNAHYAPDVASSGQHLTDLAEYLAGRGFPVRVVAGASAYAGEAIAAPRTEWRSGVHVRRLGLPGGGRRSLAWRLLGYGSFLMRAAWIVCTQRGVRAVIVLTTPPLLGVVGWLGRTVRGRPYGIWSLDLYPDAAVAAGMLPVRSWRARVARALANAAYRRADFIVDLGPWMGRRIAASGAAPERLHSIPVWAPAGADRATEQERAAIRRRYGVEGRFVVMYAGHAGVAHDVTPILGAMQRLRDDPGIAFLFVGGGPRRREVEMFVQLAGLSNVICQAYVPRSELGALLGAADVHLVSLRGVFAGISVPGKVYGAMASGRPIVFIGPRESEAGAAVEQSNCGAVIDPGDAPSPVTAERVAERIRLWRADPAAAAACGARGRAAYLANFTRDRNCAAFERIIRSAWPTLSESAPA